MKTTLLILSLFLSSVYQIIAQTEDTPKDTLFYQVNESLNMLILVKDYHHLTKDEKLKTMLIDFQSKLSTVQASIPSEAYIIDYLYDKQLDILLSDKVKSYAIRNDKGLTENFRNTALITESSGAYQVSICFDDIAELMNMDFSALLQEIKNELPEKDRYLRYLEFQKDKQNGKTSLTENRISGYLDMLSLQAGVGANVYRSKFLTDITGEMGLQLNHKGILRNQFYVSNNLIFSFDAENSAIINNFTNIGYRRNLSNQKDKPNWLGVEVGTLTKRSGDIFQPNTIRIGVNWQAGKHITIAPQLYFNGMFKQVSPGFRIGIGL